MLSTLYASVPTARFERPSEGFDSIGIQLLCQAYVIWCIDVGTAMIKQAIIAIGAGQRPTQRTVIILIAAPGI